MTNESTGRAAAARERARRSDGRFGQQTYDRAEGIELSDSLGEAAGESAHPLTTSAMAVMDERRGHAFVPASAADWPALYATEDVAVADKVIQARYFGAGGQEWLIAEMDQETGEAFGYADVGSPEWGYVSLHELGLAQQHGVPARLPAVERDLDFAPTRFEDIATTRQTE